MTVRKVLDLSASEVDIIVACGKLLREISNGFESGDITELSDESKELIAAIQNVSDSILRGKIEQEKNN